MALEKRRKHVHKSLTLAPMSLQEAENLVNTGEFSSVSHVASYAISCLVKQRNAQAQEVAQLRKARERSP